MRTVLFSLSLVLLVGVAAFGQCPGGMCYAPTSYYGTPVYSYSPRYVQNSPSMGSTGGSGGYGGINGYQAQPAPNAPQVQQVQYQRYGRVIRVPVMILRK